MRRFTAVLGALLVLAVPTSAAARTVNPFAVRGMWIWYVSRSDGGNLRTIIARAKAHGVSTLMVKAGDGTTRWNQFNSSLVRTLHANGLRACAWQYVYGNHPVAEARVGDAAVHAGADCLLIDAESEYEGKYISAQTYMHSLRAAVGTSYPLALAGFPYVDYHPAFPYSVFLGPGGAQYNAPQMYWKDIGASVDTVFSHTYALNTLYGRPIAPIGQVYSTPHASSIIRFRQLAHGLGAQGVSWWDWQEAGGSQWGALGMPTAWLASVPTVTLATLGQGAKGDLIVWAQEHLLSAGYLVPVDGRLTGLTEQAVEDFQAARGLTVDGIIGPQTWGALLALPAASVTWTATGAVGALPTGVTALPIAPPGSPTTPTTPPTTTTTTTPAPAPAPATGGSPIGAARDRVRVRAAVPASAHLRAKADEIPVGLGRG